MPQAIMEVGRLSKFIGVIGKQKVRIDGMIQTAAVQVIAQSIVHRNSTPAVQLFDAVGTSSRRDALVKFYETFGNLAWSRGEKKVIFCDVEAIGKPKLEWSDEYADKVAASLWYKAKPEPKVVSQYDVETKLSDFIDGLRKAGKKGVTLVNEALLDQVEALYCAHISTAFVANAKADQAIVDEGERAQAVVDARSLPVVDATLLSVAA